MSDRPLFFDTTNGNPEYGEAEHDALIAEIVGEGVLPGRGQEFAASVSGRTVTIGTGTMALDGKLKPNRAPVQFTIPVPVNGPTGHRIVMRRTSNGVSLQLLSSNDGVSALPAKATTRGSTFDGELWNISATSGAVTLTDARSYAHAGSRVSDAMLDVGKLSIPRRQGGSETDWGSGGTTVYPVSGSPIFLPGVTLVDEAGAIQFASGTYFKDVAVSFPVPFPKPPFVLVGSVCSGVGDEMWQAEARSRTVNGFTLRVLMDRLDGNATHIPWFALAL